jgi:GNAT superfamily N-acetyltransferase
VARPLIRRAGPDDLQSLADLRYAWGTEAAPADVTREEFRALFAEWFRSTTATHTPFLALVDDAAVGMAWLARLPRVIDPTALSRLGGDLQSVYVLPDHRDSGLGELLVAAALALAADEGMEHVTVSSSSRAVPLYKRSGFALSPRLLKHVPLRDPARAVSEKPRDGHPS